MFEKEINNLKRIFTKKPSIKKLAEYKINNSNSDKDIKLNDKVNKNIYLIHKKYDEVTLKKEVKDIIEKNNTNSSKANHIVIFKIQLDEKNKIDVYFIKNKTKYYNEEPNSKIYFFNDKQIKINELKNHSPKFFNIYKSRLFEINENTNEYDRKILKKLEEKEIKDFESYINY